MAKRAGSKGSRSGRRAGKDRVQRARERGLPERVEPLRVRAATPEPRSAEGEDPSSDAAPARGAKSAAVPPWVWVAGVALALLGGAYVLSRQRDEALTQPQPEAPAASASASEANESVPSDAASAESAPWAPAPTATPNVENTPAPSAAAPARPTVEKPFAPHPVAPRVATPPPP